MLSFFAMVATEATAQTESVTVTPVGYATFSSDKNLDFTSAKKIKAYIAQYSSDTEITFTRIYQVPANTGLLLWAAGGATEDIPVIDSAPAVSDNAFMVADDNYDGEFLASMDAYILASDENGIGFHKAGFGSSIAKGKCFLVPPISARIIMPDMETTGISATLVNSGATKSGIYNLNGQRIGKLQKGLNIVGGKKVIVK